MTKGRCPKPTALRLLQGDFDKDPKRQNKREPQPKKGRPKCPKHITGIGRLEWARICRLLEATGVLTVDCGPALETYCRSYKLMRSAFEHLDKHGTVLVIEHRGEKRTIRNPYTSDLREHSAICIKMLTEFGLTPSSRTRIQIENDLNSKTELAKKYLA